MVVRRVMVEKMRGVIARIVTTGQIDYIRIPVVTSNKNDVRATMESESGDSDPEKNPREWTTVQRKHRKVGGTRNRHPYVIK